MTDAPTTQSGPSEICLVYTTLADTMQAERLSALALKQGLCACVNRISNMQSTYLWKGERCTENEIVMLFKTTLEHAETLKLFLEKEHRYETPCILIFRAHDVSQAFGQWVQSQTG